MACVGSTSAQALRTDLVEALPFSGPIRSVAGAGGTLVAVGDAGAIHISGNGSFWNRADSGTFEDLLAVASGPGGYLAAGANGTILTSPDAIAWTKRTSGVAGPLLCASSGGGLQLVGGTSGRILTSSNSTSWTLRTTGSIFPVNGLAYGNNAHVAVCESGEIFSSPDGTTWTKQTSPATGALTAVAFSGGQFVAVGAFGEIFSSPDGAVWTERRQSGIGRLRAVSAVAGGWVVVGSDGGVLTSSDGILWNREELTGEPALGTVAEGAGALVAFDDGGGIWRSAGGWSRINPGSEVDFHSVAVSDSGVFAAVGTSGHVAVSANGSSWSHASAPTTQDLHGIAFGSTRFVAVGGNGSLFSSADGTNWTTQSSGTSAGLRAIAHGGAGFVAVGLGGACVRSTDGLAWTAGTITGSSDDFHAVAFGNGTYVAVGRWGRIATSSDGSSWNVLPDHPTEKERWLDFTGIAFRGGTFVASTRELTTFSSPDGLTWTRRIAARAPGRDFHGVVALGDRFAVFGDGGLLETSPDGSTWTSETRATSNPLRGGAFSPGLAVFVGERGTLLASRRGISAQPISVAIDEGGTGSLTVVAEGSGPFGYQWYRGLSGDESSPLAGAVEATLTINPGADGAAYWVKVSDPFGSFDSLAAAITVRRGWTAFHAGWAAAGDAAQTTAGAAQGVPVTLKISTSGQPAGNATLTYNWSGTYNVRTDNKTGWQSGTDAHAAFFGKVGLGTQADNVASAGNSTITLDGLEPAGLYELTVYAGRDSGSFAATNLNVYDLQNATVVSTAHSAGVAASSATNASVAVGLGSKAAGRIVRWTFRPTGPSVTLRTTAGGGALNSVIPQAVRLAFLSEKPVVTSEPGDADVPAGSVLTLSATVAGSGLTYQWFRTLPGGSAEAVAGATGPTLALGSVEESAEYFVRVTGSGGTVDSAPAGILAKRTFSQWAAREGVPEGSATVDSDGDGLENLVEFALGLDPLVPTPTLDYGVDGEDLVLAYSGSREADGIAVVAESSASLMPGSWNAVAAHPLPPATFVSENLEARVPLGSGRMFLRLRVTQQ